MDERRMPEPKIPFAEALKHTPKENEKDAGRLYDGPDRREVTEANRDEPAEAERRAPDPAPSVGTDNPPG